MWTCKNCSEHQSDGFDACWNCGASQAGELDPSFEVDETVITQRENQRSDFDCLRCQRPLDFMGTRYFHEGARLGVFGNLAELFVSKEAFDIYTCGGCGHVDFFLSNAR